MRRLPALFVLLLPLVALAENPFGTGPQREKGLKSFTPDAPKEDAGLSNAGPPRERVKTFDADPPGAKPTPPPASLSLTPVKDRPVPGYEPPPPGAGKEEQSKAAPEEVRNRGRVDEFNDPDQPAEPPFRWRFALLGVIFVALAVPSLRLAYRRFSHEMELEGAAGSVPSDIAAQRRNLDQPVEKQVAPSEKAMGIVRRAGGWVSVGRVAVQCGVDVTEAAEILGGLTEEGRLESGTDAEGRTLFRYPKRAG